MKTPQLSNSETEAIIAANNVPRDRFPVILVGIRGYYLDSMGAPGANDRRRYDDAHFLCWPDGIARFVANCDPNGARKGSGTGGNKGMASLKTAMDAAINLGLMVRPKEIFAINDLNGLYRAIHRYGFVHLAFNITDAWSHPSTSGWLREDSHLPLIGGHAVAGCGFDRNAKGWNAIQNSWSDTNGWHGFLRMTHEQFDRQFMYGLAWR